MSGPRVLVLGPLGPPHVSDQAIALRERGMDVRVGGNTSMGELEHTFIQDAGIPVTLAPARSRNTPIGMAATVRWARRLIADVEPDVVQAHWLPGFGFAAAAAGASPLAVTAWGSDVYRATAAMRLANRFTLRRADLLLADSQDLLDACDRFGSARRTALVQWGVDLEGFSPPADGRAAVKQRLGLGPGPVVLSPRSLMPVYNIPVVTEAFRAIGDALPDAQLVLKHMGSVQIELPDLPHPERVQLVGNVSYEEMADYYRAADVCVSVTSSDSSPRSVWEAMACGCPCVLSDLPWIDELVRPAEAALTVPIDPRAVADAVIRVLTDPALAGSLAARARALVAQQLDQAAAMDRLAEALGGLTSLREV